MSGSCAIYVPKRQLDVEKKILGETSTEDCRKHVVFMDIHGATDIYPPHFAFDIDGATQLKILSHHLL